MKIFIGKTVIFVAILVLFFAINFGINAVLIKKSFYTVHSETLIVGDSHVQRAIEPSLFSNAVNVSQTAEPYVLTFWKLKNLINGYKPDTIILGFAPHNIAKFNDYKFTDAKWMAEMFSRSYTIQEFSSLKDEIAIDYKEYYKVLFKKMCFYPNWNHLEYIGSYSNSNKSKISDFENTIKRHYYYTSKHPEVSETAIRYLDSIVNLVSKRQKTLILLNTPVHHSYSKRIPQEIDSAYQNLVEEYKNEDISIIDKSTTSYNDSLFLNSDHLNEYGARKFTEELHQIIKNEAY